MAFVSAEDLTGVPTGGKKQLYVRDRTDGKTVLASSTAAGAAADENVDEGDSFNPFHDISADGRYVVFGSGATNLVDGDNNAKIDVFRKDLVSGELVRLSVTSAGEQGNNDSSDPSVSGDGTRVAFRTAATNILPGVTTSGIALRDTATGTTTLVSANSAGTQANDFSERPTISADGTTVAFEAGPMTDNLYPNDNNATNDIIVKTLATGVAVPAAVVSSAATMEAGDVKGGNFPDISGNGRYVVFTTGGGLDPVNDNNAKNDVYLRDLVSGTSTLVSARNGLAGPGDGASSNGVVSADGARVSFTSESTNLVAGDSNAVQDVFARTLADLTTVRLSEKADGTGLADLSDTAGISGNGGLGLLTSKSPFAADDNNAVEDVYGKELTPTDTTAPRFTAIGSEGGIGGPFASGNVDSDPSGIAAVLVDGRPARVNSDGSFNGISTPVDNLTTTVVVIDGAGNAAQGIFRLRQLVCCSPRPRIVPRVSVRVWPTRRTIRVRVKSNVSVQGRFYAQRVVSKKGKRPDTCVRRRFESSRSRRPRP